MERDEALKLINHHYRLLTQIKPKIDTSPPVSFYASPKSIHYVPFSLRKCMSLGELKRNNKSISEKKLLLNNKSGKDALENFVLTNNIPKTTIEYQLNSFNINARRSFLEKEAQIYSNRNKFLKHLDIKIDDNYECKDNLSIPNNKLINNSTCQYKGLNSEKDMTRKYQMEKIKLGRNQYIKFKNDCLESILEKNVFSDRMIKESIYQEMDKNIGKISMDDMESVFLELCEELGVPTNGKMDINIEQKNHLLKTISPSSSSLSSTSKTISSKKSSIASYSKEKKQLSMEKESIKETLESNSISSVKSNNNYSPISSITNSIKSSTKTSSTSSNSLSLSSSSSANSSFSSRSSLSFN
uniref:EF-hand domain-containing protein n=1 Tax=Strongyloides stercoralis TaxID=6248 RepID=A0A0K0E8M2_STRER